MAQSDFKKYQINSANFNAGDITTGFFDDTGPGTTLRVHYQKVGKLYFGFWAEQLVNNQCCPIVGGTNGTQYDDTVARIATQIGFTVDTAYKNSNQTMYGQSTFMYWAPGGATWTNTGGTTTIHEVTGILST